MGIILEGIITGLLLSIFVGATFFVLIETSMTRGFRAALWFDLGVLSCDSLIITTVYFFTAAINRILVQNFYFNVIGGIAFIGFGLNYILARQKEEPHLKYPKQQGNQAFSKRLFHQSAQSRCDHLLAWKCGRGANPFQING